MSRGASTLHAKPATSCLFLSIAHARHHTSHIPPPLKTSCRGGSCGGTRSPRSISLASSPKGRTGIISTPIPLHGTLPIASAWSVRNNPSGCAPCSSLPDTHCCHFLGRNKQKRGGKHRIPCPRRQTTKPGFRKPPASTCAYTRTLPSLRVGQDQTGLRPGKQQDARSIHPQKPWPRCRPTRRTVRR